MDFSKIMCKVNFNLVTIKHTIERVRMLDIENVVIFLLLHLELHSMDYYYPPNITKYF